MRKAVRAIIIQDKNLLVMHRNKFGKKYYTLIGGGIDYGETAEEALVREVREETKLTVTSCKLVFVEEPGDPYGTQYIYLCDFQGSEASLTQDSDEAKINHLGQNLYTPMWLPIDQLSSVTFVTKELQSALLDSFTNGFPDQPIRFESQPAKVV